MTTVSELHYRELTEVAGLIHSGQVSPVELAQAQLARIRSLDGRLRSFAFVMEEQALAEARQAEAEVARGDIRGPLHGVPVAVKDLCWTKGVPTAAGMAIHRDFRPQEDATVVRRLRDAGAVILGKLQLTEGAYADHHPDVSPPVSPWNADTWVGSSSSGSGVATAAGLCFASLGTDTGGSIRFPSAASGLTGLKPTWGRVSRHGVFELAATLDHVGPMARSAADCAAMLGVLAGADPADPTASLEPVPDYAAGLGLGLRGLRIGVDPAFNAGADAVMLKATEDALGVIAGLGGDIREVTLPDVARIVEDWFPLCGVETAVAHDATYPARRAEYGPGLAGLIELGRAQSGMDHQRMLLRRMDFSGRLRALFEGIDLLVVPAQGYASPTLARMATLGVDADLITGLLRPTCPFNMSGSPTITLPCGFTERGTPVAFQFVSRHMEEALLLRAGHAFQQATDWHRRHPAL